MTARHYALFGTVACGHQQARKRTDKVRDVTCFNCRRTAVFISSERSVAMSAKSAQGVFEYAVDLGKLALQFGRTDRITLHPDGKTRESCTDHTVMLGLVACELAGYYPGLRRGRIAELCFVHDLIEAIAGDTDTRKALTNQQAEQRKQRETAAFEQLCATFGDGSWLVMRIREYEGLNSPEARFVKIVDKIMPKITHMLNAGAALGDLLPEDLQAVNGIQRLKLEEWADPEWDLLLDVYDAAVSAAILKGGGA